MKHLINDSVYAPEGMEIYPLPECDGIELLTGHVPIEPRFFENAVSVHLPYCTDWYSVWCGRLDVPDDISEDNVRFIFYGRDRESIIDTMHDMIDIAGAVSPAYGILHAGSANFDELLLKRYSDSDESVLKAFAEAINSAVADFPKGEPPFRILFENQWWPGLRMLDGSNYRTLCNEIEFENWGLCLDTGHLLVTSQKSYDECQAVELLKDIFAGYPKDMIDTIKTMHFHVNCSGKYISSYVPDSGFNSMDLMSRLSAGYRHVCNMDQHLPFSVSEAKELTEILKPDYVTHEMGVPDLNLKRASYLQQRSLFD